MASGSSTAGTKRRGILSRIGVCALNLLAPGLGLVRLARYPLGALFFLIAISSALVIYGGYFLIENMQFAEWAVLAGTFGVLLLVAYLGSIFASWRIGKTLELRTGWMWKWYGVLILWAAWVLVGWPMPDIARSRYRSFYIASISMLPTMQVNDRFLADMHNIGAIARGDVVIVHANGEDFVKRVAGIPGDRISLIDGRLLLNGKPVSRQFNGGTHAQSDWGVQQADVFQEQFPGEAKPHLVMDTGPSAIDNFAEITLPPDRYFLLGDNRDHSADSRLPPGFEEGLGLVARSSITGRVAFRYWRSGVGFGPDEN